MINFNILSRVSLTNSFFHQCSTFSIIYISNTITIISCSFFLLSPKSTWRTCSMPISTFFFISMSSNLPNMLENLIIIISHLFPNSQEQVMVNFWFVLIRIFFFCVALGDQAKLELTEIPLPVSLLLELKACATTIQIIGKFFKALKCKDNAFRLQVLSRHILWSDLFFEPMICVFSFLKNHLYK